MRLEYQSEEATGPQDVSEQVVRLANLMFWVEANLPGARDQDAVRELRAITRSMFELAVMRDDSVSELVRDHLAGLAARAAACVVLAHGDAHDPAAQRVWPHVALLVATLQRSLI